MSEHYIDDWAHYLDSVTINDRIDEKQKKRLLESIQTLRKNLGEDWPAESKNTSHAVLWSLRIISGAMADGLLVLWGDSISEVENIKNFENILVGIRDPVKFDSSMAELEVASRLARHGYCIEFGASVGAKKPDLLCQYKKLRFFVEIKTFFPGREAVKATNTTTGVLTACRPIFPVGIIFKPLSKSHLDEVIGTLSQEAKNAISNKIAIEVNLGRALKVYLVPDELSGRVEMCKKWLDNQEDTGVMPKGNHWLCGPPNSMREEQRIKTRIRRMVGEHQIPLGTTGVLVITGLFSFWNIDDAERLVDSIIEDVYDLENIPAVVLISSKIFGESEIQVVEKDDFIFIRNRLYEYIEENTIIVKNRFFKPEFDYKNLKLSLLVGVS